MPAISKENFGGLRVLALESRRAQQIAKLITNCGGEPLVTPSAENMESLDALVEALARVVIASIGPLTSEEIRSRGLDVDLECSHPKMGVLVQEAAAQSAQLLAQKRSVVAQSAEGRSSEG